jgi:hypothetical protein
LTRSLETEVGNDATKARNTLSANQVHHLNGAAMSVEERLERIEQMLATLVQQQTIKEWYTTAEVGGLLGRAEYTVREWCRQGRIRAKKKPCGRGKGGEWLVSHEELTRLKNEGLLPFRSAVS